MEPYSMKNPYPATVQGVRPVTKPGSAKETIHIDYNLGDSGLTYVTGDALGVFPCNDPVLVDASSTPSAWMPQSPSPCRMAPPPP